MKKLFMALLCAGLLVGCSSSDHYDVKVSQDSDVLISHENLSITKQGYFEYLLDKYGDSEIINEVMLLIADKELDNQDEIDKLVKERKEQYTMYAEGGLDDYAKQVGYDSTEDYVNEVILPDVKRELLQKKYVQDNLDDLVKEYQVCTIKNIIVDKESTALKIIKEATSEDKFDALMKDDEYSSKANDVGVVTKNSSSSTVDENLKDKLEELSNLDKDGVYSKAIKLSDGTYAVVYVYDTEHKDTDKITTALTNDEDAKYAIEGKWLKKYHFAIHDNKLKDAVKKLSSEYIE